MAISRRNFLGNLVAGGLGLSAGRLAFDPNKAAASAARQPFFQTRGVVLVPSDLTWRAWPQRAKAAGLTTIGLHHGADLRVIREFLKSDSGGRLLEDCRRQGLQVEYELHAMRDLLPRSLFARNPELFRMTESGQRAADCNLCVHSQRALEIVAENALALARTLRPETSRYFFWGDDAQPWCRCPRCRALSEADQALVVENHLLGELRKFDPGAQLAHLAYANTVLPPTQIKPAPGVFLEFAPIHRRYDIPYDRQKAAEDRDKLEWLDANLALFGASGAQALEYWLDASRFSHWKKPSVKVPWRPQVFSEDLTAYGSRRIRHLTSFAVFIDADYVAAYGEPPLADYGKRLVEWTPQRPAGG